MIELSYSVSYAGALFDMPTSDPSRMIVLYYKQYGTSSFNQAAIFSTLSNASLITKTNTNPAHTLGINITDFIGSGRAITALGTGDSLRVEYHLQTTANIPIGAPALVSVQAEVYIKNGTNKQTCYPRLQTIKTFNYIRAW
jgi:hypothetical protein